MIPTCTSSSDLVVSHRTLHRLDVSGSGLLALVLFLLVATISALTVDPGLAFFTGLLVLPALINYLYRRYHRIVRIKATREGLEFFRRRDRMHPFLVMEWKEIQFACDYSQLRLISGEIWRPRVTVCMRLRKYRDIRLIVQRLEQQGVPRKKIREIPWAGSFWEWAGRFAYKRYPTFNGLWD